MYRKKGTYNAPNVKDQPGRKERSKRREEKSIKKTIQ
jgi:hypothetical protein